MDIYVIRRPSAWANASEVEKIGAKSAAFSRAFKKLVGMSPAAWRNNSGVNAGVVSLSVTSRK